MVKIITPGKKKEEDPIYFKCGKCDCVFTAEEEDVEEEFDPKCDSYLVCECPCCGARVIIRA